MIDKDLFEKGIKIRREVMGDARVDTSMSDLDDFNRDFMEQFITEMGWGAVWGREGLTRKQRSLLNLGMLAALGRMTEFEGHFRGAINNGLTREELRAMRSALRERQQRGTSRLRQRLRDYLRRDFHPNQVDDLALARERLAALGLEPAA